MKKLLFILLFTSISYSQSRRHNLTYKTAYNYKQKVIKDFGFMNLESYLKKNKLSNEEKLMRFIEEMKNV